MKYKMSFLEVMIFTFLHGILSIIRIPGTIFRLITIGTDWVAQRWIVIQGRNYYSDLLK